MKPALLLFLILGLQLAQVARSQTVARVMQDGVWGVIDQRGHQIVEPKYSYIDEFVGQSAVYEQSYLLGLLHADGRVLAPAEYEAIEYFQVPGDDLKRIATHARVLKDERWGMVDLTTGQLVIPCKWDYINYYSGDRVFVNTGGREVMRQGFMEYDGGKWGVFTASGQKLTEPKYEYPEAFLGASATVTFEGYEGLLGKDGQWVVEPRYSQFKTLDIKGQATQYLAVRKDDKLGWVDRAGKQFVKPVYSEVIWESGRTGRVLAKRDGRWGVVSFSGEQLVPFEYDVMQAYDREGRLLVGVGGKYGLLDSRGATIRQLDAGSYTEVNGEWVLFDAVYADFSTPGHGLIAAQDAAGKWALLSTQPVKVLSDPVFDYAEPVFEGHFKTMKTGKWAIASAKGQNTFGHQLNDIQSLNAKWGAGMKAGDWFFITPDGKLNNEEKYDRLRAMDSRRIAAMKAGKWGLLSSDLELLLDFKYESIEPYGASALLVYNGKHYFTVDTLGQPLIETPLKAIQAMEFGQSVVLTKLGWGTLGADGKLAFTPDKNPLFVLGDDRLLEKEADGITVHLLNSAGKVLATYTAEDTPETRDRVNFMVIDEGTTQLEVGDFYYLYDTNGKRLSEVGYELIENFERVGE